MDGVTELTFEPWARAAAPALYATEASQFAQYGLPPPAPLDPDAEEIFPPGAHCMATYVEEALASTLLPLAELADGLAPLTVAELDDGPWCPHDDAPGRFDADWFRLRRIDVRLRVEALPAEFRGSAGPWFSRAQRCQELLLGWAESAALQRAVRVVAALDEVHRVVRARLGANPFIQPLV